MSEKQRTDKGQAGRVLDPRKEVMGKEKAREGIKRMKIIKICYMHISIY